MIKDLDKYIDTLECQDKSLERLRDGYKTEKAKLNTQKILDEDAQIIAWLKELSAYRKKYGPLN